MYKYQLSLSGQDPHHEEDGNIAVQESLPELKRPSMYSVVRLSPSVMTSGSTTKFIHMVPLYDTHRLCVIRLG